MNVMNTLVREMQFVANDEIGWVDLDRNVRRKIMAYDDNLMLVKVEFKSGGVGPLHKHVHSQITHVDSGVFEVEIGAQKKILKAGDVFYVSPNVLHGAVCIEDGLLIDVFSPMREDFI
jgi:quercetin dioxygenase-like cupin family protein